MKPVSYFKKVYPDIWKKRVGIYGFDDYTKALVDIVISKKPTTVFEMAIGTGWPVASSLSENGIDVSGCDVSGDLLDEVKKNYPDIKVRLAGYEELEIEKKYDLVYCFRSSWYFHDILRAVDKMIILAKNGGIVMFDIMNAASPYIKKVNLQHYLKTPVILMKNMVRSILNLFFNGKFQCDTLIMPEIPTEPGVIDAFLEDKEIAFEKYSYNQIVEGVHAGFEPDSFRMVYMLKVEK